MRIIKMSEYFLLIKTYFDNGTQLGVTAGSSSLLAASVIVSKDTSDDNSDSMDDMFLDLDLFTPKILLLVDEIAAFETDLQHKQQQQQREQRDQQQLSIQVHPIGIADRVY
jgi:hypothetical protein